MTLHNSTAEYQSFARNRTVIQSYVNETTKVCLQPNMTWNAGTNDFKCIAIRVLSMDEFTVNMPK